MPPVFKLDNQDVIDFYASQRSTRIPRVPELDPKFLVDGDRTIQFLRPLPVSSDGRDFEFRSRVLGVYDKGDAGTVVRSEDLLVDASSDEAYARIVGSLFYVGQGNWGGPRGPPAITYPPPSDKSPDLSITIRIDERSAHLYRYEQIQALNHFAQSLTASKPKRGLQSSPCHARGWQGNGIWGYHHARCISLQLHCS